MSSNNSCLKALSFVTRLDISIMYSLMFPLPLYHIETILLRIVLVSTFLLAVNRFVIFFKKRLASLFSVIPLLKDSRIECCIIIKLMRFDHSHFLYADFSSLVLVSFKSVGRSNLNA